MSRLSSISIRRPVLASVMSIVIVVFGIIGFNSLGVREYPSVDPPIITVVTNYVGADAQIIESQITEPLEEQINSIAGIRTLKSVSRTGRSTITVEFNLDSDLEAAANDVRDRVSRAQRRLPPDADPPTVEKSDADATPIVFLNIQSEKRNLLELTDYAENLFKERFQTIDGVSEVRIWGSKKYAMRLWMDPVKMAAFDVTTSDVRNALQAQNVELPSGSIEGDLTELNVETQGRLYTPDEFNQLIIKSEGNTLIRFQDIGYAELGPEELRTVLKRDNIPMVGNVLIPQPGANYIEIVDEFYVRLERIKKDLPDDIKLDIGFDDSIYIRDSISEVQQTIITAFILVMLIIMLFLRDWRTTLIPIIVIPISLIGSFFVMYLLDFSINVLTLLAIVLAIGLVVDDAVVVMENIYSKIEAGEAPKEASEKGTAEIFFAVIATTITLASVFVPVIFLEGITGRLFTEFALVVAGSVVISSFVALTLTPMLSSKILKKQERKNAFYRKTEPFFIRLNKLYVNSLEAFMRFKWVAFPALLMSVGGIYYLLNLIPSELAPIEDRSSMRSFITGPEGATYEYMDEYMDNVYQLISKTYPDEKNAVITVTSPGFGASTSINSGFMRFILVDPEKREKSQQEIANELTQLLRKKAPGAQASIIQKQTIGGQGGGGGLPVKFVVQAPNFEALQEAVPKFMEKARSSDVFGYVDVDIKFNKPELSVEIQREKAQSLGVSVLDVAENLQLALSGQRIGYFIKDGKQYEIRGQLERQWRNEPDDLNRILIPSSDGNNYTLDNFVEIKDKTNPPALYRFDRYASATFSASLSSGYSLGQGIEEMERIQAEVLDDSFVTALDGASKDFQESADSLFFAFGMALLLIFLVLAAQFESFRDPITIMITVPMALLGAILALWFFGQTLNIFSQIGMIILIGLITKNAILVVEFANQKKAQGMDKLAAVKEAAAMRFRPILMTTLSTVLGILPIALAIGAGAESRKSMGIGIIGGLLIASLLSLYIIPAFYYYISEKDKNKGETSV